MAVDQNDHKVQGRPKVSVDSPGNKTSKNIFLKSNFVKNKSMALLDNGIIGCDRQTYGLYL